MTGPDVRAQIVGEIYTALERLDADDELLSIIGSWRDTLDDADVLSMPQGNAVGRYSTAGIEAGPQARPSTGENANLRWLSGGRC